MRQQLDMGAVAGGSEGEGEEEDGPEPAGEDRLPAAPARAAMAAQSPAIATTAGDETADAADEAEQAAVQEVRAEAAGPVHAADLVVFMLLQVLVVGPARVAFTLPCILLLRCWAVM